VRVKDESKVNAIFEATLSLVKDKGLAGITMSDISREASIATGTLYIYFKNKNELIKALFAECRLASAEQYFAGIDPQASYEERMRKLFGNIIRYKMMRFEVSAFLEQTYHSPFLCITDIKKKQKALQPLFDMVRQGVKEKRIKDVDEGLIISYLFGIINEIVKKSYFSNKKLTQESIDRLYGMFWDGISLRGQR
jgi:AcrR family transcriptional regulator